MASITITKAGYTKFVDAAAEAFTAQCGALTSWVIVFGADEPSADEPGVIVPPGLPYAVTRANGSGHGWGKLPPSAPVATAAVIVVGA